MLNTEESRKGAMACLSAIRIIGSIKKHHDPDASKEDYWRKQDATCTAMLLAAGEQPDFITGFIAAMSEYVSNVVEGGVPDPYVWKPEAAMTEEERATERALYEEVATE
jgi:hypothetical protein